MTKFNFSIIDPPSASVPLPIEKKGYGAQKYISFGEDNLYPEFLLTCYEQCAVLQSIINGLADYISGSGFVSGNPDMVVNEKGETLLDVVQKTTVDYLIYGAFSLGIRRNNAHEIAYIDYHDTRTIRLNEDADMAVYCKDWAKSSSKKVSIPIFNPKNTAQDRTEFYVKHPTCRHLYGLPIWNSAAKDVQTAIEIATFHLSAILNNFAPSAIVNFNNGQPAEEQQKEIEKRLNKKFSGAKNAARLLVCFNDDKEHGTDLQRLSEDNFDQRYNALAKSVKENIFISFRAHPQLFGADPERQGFNSVEYSQTFQLFKETVVHPLQRQIEDAFAKIAPQYQFTLADFNIEFETAQEGGTI